MKSSNSKHMNALSLSILLCLCSYTVSAETPSSTAPSSSTARGVDGKGQASQQDSTQDKANNETDQSAAKPPDADKAKTLESVEVTGSRVISSSFLSTNPMVTIGDRKSVV